MRWLWLMPAAALLALVLAVPLAGTLPPGITRLPHVFGDATFARIVGNTLKFAAASVVAELALGLIFAVLLHETFRLRGLVRAIALLPWALPTAVMAMSWLWIFNDTYGIANDLPLRLGLLREPVVWLGKPGTAFFALVLADVWKTTPFVTILLLAGLQSIPRDLYEAMALDGAGRIRRFVSITLPMLRPAMALALTFRIIHALGIFDLVWVLTRGGPANATKTVAVYIYDQYFRYGERAYGAALTIVVAVGMFALAAGAGRLVRGRERAL